MNFDEYQNLATRTINKSLTIDKMRTHALHEIAAEVGEVHSIYQKELQGHKIDNDALKLEIGDILWGIAELCTALGIKMDDVAQANIEKLRKRYPGGFSTERSLHRAE